MLIPAIDLMGGKIVQLVQGERKALEFDDFEPWIARFAKYPLVQLIDLDAAKRQGDNRALICELARRLPCQVGGGIHTLETAQTMLSAGARRVILGSSLIKDDAVNVAFASGLARAVGSEKLVFSIDSRQGVVTTHGWKSLTAISPFDMVAALEPFCSAFLYTNVDTEGLMRGIPFDVVERLRVATQRQLIVAGGIASDEEIARLDAIGVDAVVGMAVYTGKISA